MRTYLLNIVTIPGSPLAQDHQKRQENDKPVFKWSC